jgi:hypothetical protein
MFNRENAGRDDALFQDKNTEIVSLKQDRITEQHKIKT